MIRHSLREQIKHRLSSFDVHERSAERKASVALIVTECGYGSGISDLPVTTEWNAEPALILTRRAAHLNRHAGQWALPGGRVDANETLMQTSIRETCEEIHLDLSSADYLGRLDDYVTRSGFAMSGLVYWGGKADQMFPAPDEVAAIHRIPFTELLRHDAPILAYDELTANESLGEQNHPVLRMPVGQDWIAAPTAALLYQFREVCLLGKQTRVAHFEEPKFAWK